MRSTSWTIIDKKLAAAMLVTGLLSASAMLAQTAAPAKPKAAAKPASQGFATPDEAAQALIQAAGAYDTAALTQILGADAKDLISSADPVEDKNNAVAFAASAKEKLSVVTDPATPTRAIVSVGNQAWPLPIPIVKKSGKWYFDAKAGRDEILYRRIGGNELDAIQVCRGIVEAQEEYASAIHNGGIRQYAQRIISTPGKQDGLYWKNADGTAGGPVSEAVAKAIEQGYSLSKDTAYHGYYFRLLKGQGPAANLGELDYLVGGVMIGGFALVAVPAQYRVTGVQTFIVNHDGVVYQKDLGPDSVNLVKQMERFNPDKTWRRTDDQWDQ